LIQKLWTSREFSNDFNLTLEFRARQMLNSGIFIRGPATSVSELPRRRSLQRPEEIQAAGLEFNRHHRHQQYRVLHLQPELLTNALPVPPTGAIGFEGDRGQME